jgi:hypothetical protein
LSTSGSRITTPINAVDLGTWHKTFLSSLSFSAQIALIECGALALDKEDQASADNESGEEKNQVDRDGIVVEGSVGECVEGGLREVEESG